MSGRRDSPRPVLVCASNNPDKVAEIAAVLGEWCELQPRPAGLGEVVEDADTLAGNARLKALAVCAASGQAAVADDTGLFVDALEGRPGVHSARYAGPRASSADNRAKLLAELHGVPAASRLARFVTSVVVRWPDGRELVVEGVCEGVITAAERGARGFGYDSLFVPGEGDGRTFAEMSEAEKNELSHRGRALRALVAVWPA